MPRAKRPTSTENYGPVDAEARGPARVARTRVAATPQTRSSVSEKTMTSDPKSPAASTRDPVLEASQTSRLTMEALLRQMLPPGIGLGLGFSPELERRDKPAERAVGLAKRSREFDLGRQCAVQALREVGWQAAPPTMAEPPELTQVVGVNADRSPAWPTGFVGSISHSRRWVCAVAANSANYRSLGLDTESLMPAATRALVQGEVGAEEEWALLGHALPAERAVTMLFSAKEAFFKLWYPLTRRLLSFHEVRLVSVTSDAAFRPTPHSPLQSRFWLSLIRDPDGHSAEKRLTSQVLADWLTDDVVTAAWLTVEPK